jgi:hypothetical protein
MRVRLRAFWALAAAVAVVGSALAAPAFAGDGGPVPADPGPYCRPVASAPYTYTGPTKESVGIYGFGIEGDTSLHCNGPIYAGAITAILHYQTNGVGGAQAGSSTTCGGSCDASAYYYRHGLHCGEYYNYDDYTQITGYWQQTSTSARVNVSLNSAHTKGTSHFPAVCR